MKGRFYPPLTDEQAFEVLRSLRSPAHKLLVYVLLAFDSREESGTYLGYDAVALQTGWATKTVRNYLSELKARGAVHSYRVSTDRLTHYCVVPLEQQDPLTQTRRVAGEDPAASMPSRVPDDVPAGIPENIPEDIPTVGDKNKKEKKNENESSDACGKAGRSAVRTQQLPRKYTGKSSKSATHSKGSTAGAEIPYMDLKGLAAWQEALNAS